VQDATTLPIVVDDIPLYVIVAVHDDPLTVRVDVSPPCETVPAGAHTHEPMPASSTGAEQQTLPPLLPLLLLLLQAPTTPTKTTASPNVFRIWFPLEEVTPLRPRTGFADAYGTAARKPERGFPSGAWFGRRAPSI
jgi:hypothetical protein